MARWSFRAGRLPLLLDELERALGYPKLRKRVTKQEALEVLDLLHDGARLTDDPSGPSPVVVA